MSSFYFHFMWSLLYLFMSFMSFVLFLGCFIYDTSILIFIKILNSWLLDLPLLITLDFNSTLFSCLILFISSVVSMYSYIYMYPYKNMKYFMFLVFLFVSSMILVVNFSNLFFIMLGWDGLGLVSFFLIIFYQNFSSISSGIFTVVMNRLGDGLFILGIVMFSSNYMDFYFYSSFFSSKTVSSLMTVLVMGLSFMVKTAIFPFSSWLPKAMSAPTPISSLVHSSTLVTAGLYLFLRFSYLFYSFPILVNLFMFLSVYTSFYAGASSIFEMDFKKLVALSTLSHLGFILLSFSMGLSTFSYFHLLSHALFKSLLFMGVGGLMMSMSHSQDGRYMSSSFNVSPMSSYFILISSYNLLGLPSMTGFFSKDLVLENFHFSFGSMFVYFLIMVNVLFTYIYTYKILSMLFSWNSLSPYLISVKFSLASCLLMSILSIISVLFGFVYVNLYMGIFEEVFLISSFKKFPIFLNLFMLLFMFYSLTINFYNFKFMTGSYFYNMFYLNSLYTYLPKYGLTIGLNSSLLFNNNYLFMLFKDLKNLDLNHFSFISNNLFLSIIYFSSFLMLFFVLVI